MEVAGGDKQDEQKTERFNMFMSPSEMKAIEEWAWEKRIRSKSEAVRRLCRIGLVSESLRPPINEAMKALLDPVMLLSNEMLTERSRTPEEIEELSELARNVFEKSYALYGKILEQQVRAGGLSNGETDFQEEMDWEIRAAEFLADGPFFEKLRQAPEVQRFILERAGKRKDSEVEE